MDKYYRKNVTLMFQPLFLLQHRQRLSCDFVPIKISKLSKGRKKMRRTQISAIFAGREKNARAHTRRSLLLCCSLQNESSCKKSFTVFALIPRCNQLGADPVPEQGEESAERRLHRVAVAESTKVAAQEILTHFSLSSKSIHDVCP